jgi:hypothetical protein
MIGIVFGYKIMDAFNPFDKETDLKLKLNRNDKLSLKLNNEFEFRFSAYDLPNTMDIKT